METRWASRSGYLDSKTIQKFYKAPVVVEKYEDAIQSVLFHNVRDYLLQSNKGNIAYIRVFGELYGGKYEGHKTTHKAIQKEVSYCPDIEFIVFDIEYILEEEVEVEKIAECSEEVLARSFFLNPSEVIKLCQECNVPALEILHTGTLDEVMSLNPVFQTTIPTSLFSLDPTTHNNEAEGFVLKPAQVFYKPDRTRILLKHKNPAFTEHKDYKTTKPPPNENNMVSQELSGHEVTVFEDVKQYVNENRINAVLSKLDEISRSRRKAVLHLIANDAFEDVLQEMSCVQEASKKVRGKYKKHLNIYTEEYCEFHKIDFTA